MKNLKNTKTRLTIIFTLIISFLFLIIWNSFFVFKYFSDEKNIEWEYKDIQKIIFSKEKDITIFISGKSNNNENSEINEIIEFTKALFKNPELDFKQSQKTKDIEEVLVEWKWDFPFFNHKIIVFWESLNKGKKQNNFKDEIVYSNIEDFEEINFEKYFNEKNGLIYEKRLIILKVNIWEKKWLIFIEREYSSEDLFFDIWYLILWVLFFSIIFYLIWNIFVKRVLEPVEENIDEMNSFIDNAGHELKTPLAAIQSSASLLKEIKTFEPELIQEIIDETKKSNEIIGALRSLTKISKNSKNEKFYIKSVIKDILASQKENIKNKKINLIFDTKNKDIEINANKNYFYILLSNIISNGIKYNKTSGSLWVEIWENFITISDSGIWIPKDETKKIFERFYRIKNHNNISWYWLWLSMVEKIAKIYNWKIDIESIEGIGSKVKVRF